MYYNDNEIVKMGKNNYNNKHDNSEDNKKKGIFCILIQSTSKGICPNS